MNHIKKPIYNAYLLMSKLGSELVEATEDGNTSILVTKQKDQFSILLSHATEHFDHQLPLKEQALTLGGMEGTKTVTLWRIDSEHTDPYGMYLKEGMQDPLTQEQVEKLREIGNLKPETFSATADEKGELQLSITLKGDSLVLLQVN
jgi:beta-xylosidase